MKKLYKTGLIILALAVMGYNSVYVKRLSEVRAQEVKEVDFQAYADTLYYQGILKSERAVELSELLTAVQTDAESAFERYGNRLGIGNSAYFMVKSSGTISEITEDRIRLTTQNAGDVSINTKYIFGNALRDASGLVELTDFKTNAEFNKVSEALNTLIRTKVIPPVVQQLQVGDEVEVVGAIKLSKKELDDAAVVITPAEIVGSKQ